jgi:hypothetical protein
MVLFQGRIRLSALRTAPTRSVRNPSILSSTQGLGPLTIVGIQ